MVTSGQVPSLLRRIWLYRCGIIRITYPAARARSLTQQPRYQLNKRQQIHEAQQGLSAPHDHLQILVRKISPLRRHRPNGAFEVLQQNTLAMEVVPPADTRQPSPKLRVKRVRHAYKLLICAGKARSPS